MVPITHPFRKVREEGWGARLKQHCCARARMVPTTRPLRKVCEKGVGHPAGSKTTGLVVRWAEIFTTEGENRSSNTWRS